MWGSVDGLCNLASYHWVGLAYVLVCSLILCWPYLLLTSLSAIWDGPFYVRVGVVLFWLGTSTSLVFLFGFWGLVKLRIFQDHSIKLFS